MPRDSQGNFTNTYNWVQDAANGINIEPDRHQDGDDDQAQGLTDSLDRQGRGGMNADLAMGNNKVTQVNEGTVSSDAPNIGQIQNGAFSYSGTDLGAADAYVVTLSPTITAYNAGLTLSFIAANANTGASTLQVDGVVPAQAIQWQSLALVADTIRAGDLVTVRYNGTVFNMISSPEILAVEYGGTGQGTPLGTAAYEDVGVDIGDVTQLIDDGAAVATMPAVNAELLTNTIAGQTEENVVDPATDLVAFYDDSAGENRQTIIQTILDLVPDPPAAPPRAWVQFNAAGTILGSEGVTSVTKNATGDFTINFTVAWASGSDYAISALAQRPSNNNDIKCAIKIGTTPTATAVNIVTVDAVATLLDPSLCMVTAMGTQ